MSLKLEVCDDNDMHRTFTILSSAFGHEHPYIDAVFPSHATVAGREIGGERLRAIKHSDPNTTFLKITDTDTGEMIAQAKWNIYDGEVPEAVELDGDFWAGEEEKEYARYLFREYLVPRRAAIEDSGGHLVSLDILTVDPKHQRRGAGRMLVEWGTAIADKMGVAAVVEASKYGMPLYQSAGFEFVHHHVIDLPDKWAGRDKQTFTWMVRPKKTVD
ncbi:MAG: hypothetical protein LQ339_004240 [Xanthoria mediterranea]|nr:MAG: hypothetical protein LQ339_004240 [Xanthoria mediterranea]